MTIFLLLPLLGGAGLSVKATESYKFTHLVNRNSGLSYDAVKCIIQDSRGFIWIGTQKGLNRYDGSRFKVYDREDFGVESDHISSLAEAPDGNIWIGTDNGVTIYNYYSDSFSTLTDMAVSCLDLNDRVYAIRCDSKGQMWVGTRTAGLFRYNLHTGVLERLPIYKENGEEVNNVYRIAIDRNDCIWLASYCDNIYRLDTETGRLHAMKTAFFDKDDVEGLIINPKSNDMIYVASKRHGLCEVKVRDLSIRQLAAIPEEHRPIDLYLEGSKNLWLPTTAGLIHYDISNRCIKRICNEPDDEFSLSDDYVTSVLADNKGDLWVGTTYGGLNYYGKHQDLFTKIYKTSDGKSLKGCIVRSLAQDKHGIVWVGTEKMGLLSYDASCGRLSQYSNPSIPKNINALCINDESLWIGSHKGVCRLDFTTGRVTQYERFGKDHPDKDNRIVSLFLSAYGEIYVATAIGVYRYNTDNDNFTIVESIVDIPIEHMVEDSQGIIWMASYHNGVYAYDPITDSVKRHYCIKNGTDIIPEMVSSMCIDNNGDIWSIGFSSGFFKYDAESDTFEKFDRKVCPSLPSNVYLSCLCDYDGTLWLSSDVGLVAYFPLTNTAKVFRKGAGILNDTFTKSALMLDSGEMLFGSSDGFIVFKPEEFVREKAVSGVMITDLIVGDMVVCPTDNDSPVKCNINIADKVVLKHSQNSFGFNFALTDPGLSGNNDIICKLDGYDKEWQDVSTARSIYYYNLPAGSYRLYLRSVNSSGQLSRSHDGIDVIVKPTFIASPIGIIIILLSVILLGTAVFYFVRKRDLEKARHKREEFERKKMDEVYDEKMTFFSNVIHEIKTPLTLIQTPLQNICSSEDLSPTIREDLRVISNSTEYLDQLVKELLENIRIEKHGYVLDRRNVDLIEKINFACFNFSETSKDYNLKLSFLHEEENLMIAADVKGLNKIINNLIHNAIKYATSYITIKVSKDEENVKVSFRNDGPKIPESRRTEIFKQFVQFSQDKTPYSQSFGIGLPLARTLAELHGGTLVLADSDETEFILTLPLVLVDENVRDEDKQEEIPVNPSKPLIMIVEDNSDLLSYMKSKMKVEYNVIIASSAERALELLKKYRVDIVLTDVALRGMSGVELCRHINTGFETSHIPVIVLSAISSVDTKISCMRNGAVLYMEKPFSLDYLMASVKGILNKRNSIKNAYNTQYADKRMSHFSLADRDQEFITALEKLIMENIGNVSFTVQQMEESLAMSRSSFNRKMKELLNTTPNDYLRSKRMALAAKMLESGNIRVSEVCYAVGFNSPSYFSKCFKETYGKLPLEYARSARGEKKSE